MMATDTLMNLSVLLMTLKPFASRPRSRPHGKFERKTPDCASAEVVIASTALRAYRNRHLKALIRYCEAWEPVGRCFEPISLECTDFQKLCHIIANLTL